MPKAYKAYDEFEDEDIIVFSDSEQRAKEILYKIITEDDYEGESFEIERVPELDYLNRKNGYVMQSSYKDDWIALLKIGYTCKNSEEMADYCEYCDNYEECLEMIKEEKEYEK